MIPERYRRGEIAIIGLARSGLAVTELLWRGGASLYASDGTLVPDARERFARLNAGIEQANQNEPADLPQHKRTWTVQFGKHDLDRIAGAVLVVTSPGVPPEAAPLATARAAGIPIVSELEVALWFLRRARVMAITGTNGKTTTTALAADLLRALGQRTVEGGNIGTPLSTIALAPQKPAWIALEVSSFQLHDTPSLDPAVGVLTNLSPDHLDRYPSVEDYYADKALLFRNARPDSRWVLNADSVEPPLPPSMQTLPGTVSRFSLVRQDVAAWYDRAAGMLVVDGAPLLPRSELSLLGDHNVANALAASLAVIGADPAYATDEAREAVAGALRAFRALPHRLELVGEVDGVQWINDSKATNLDSTLVAVQGMTRPTVLLLGGRHKGEPYTALAEPLRRAGRAVIAYGEAGPLVAKDLEGVVPLELLGHDFEEVVERARSLAQPGDAVLLSPACSSYDMFENYEERGAVFRRLAMPPE